jgi:hypothetical protein
MTTGATTAAVVAFAPTPTAPNTQERPSATERPDDSFVAVATAAAISDFDPGDTRLPPSSDHSTGDGREARPKPIGRIIAAVVSVMVIVAGAFLALTAFDAHASVPKHSPPTHHVSAVVTSASLSVISPTTTASVQVPANADASAPGLTVNSGENESDPFLYLDSNRYYLYTSGIPSNPTVNVPVTSTTDFSAWSPVSDALPVLPAWAGAGFTWAPDIHQFGSTYVLYFTAILSGTGEECIGDAVSSLPTGPFTPESAPFICQQNLGGSIDPRVFTATDGTNWMLWKSDQNYGGRTVPTTLWSQRLTQDGLGLVGSPADLMSPDEPWQSTIVEAPDMLEVDGTYWVFYSGSWFNRPAYAIGAARCAGPAGPCADTTGAPLLGTNVQGSGPGEASVFADSAGVWMLYTPSHAQGGNPPRPVYITRLGFNAQGPYLAAGGPPPDLAPPTGQPAAGS